MRSIALALCAFVALAAADWPVARVRESLVKIRTEDGQCSGVSITKSVILTASHCVKDGLYVETPTVALEAEVVHKDPEAWGLALVKVAPVLRPLELGPEPAPGQEVVSIAFGMGAPQPWIVPAVIHSTQPSSDGDGPFLHVSANSISGMSGGPVVDRKGRLISVVIGGYAIGTELQAVGLDAPYAKVKAMVAKAKEIR